MFVFPDSKRSVFFTLCTLTLFSFQITANDTASPRVSFIDSLLTTMNASEKAGQMILVYHSSYDFLNNNRVGGVLILKDMLKNPDSLRRELLRIQEKLPIPLLVTIDQEGGTVNRLSSLPGWKNLPSAAVIGTWKPDSITNLAQRMAAKLKWLGINMNLAPVMDPAVNGQNQSTYMGKKNRSFGNGAEKIAPAANAFIRGFSHHGVLCVAKHFPGYDVTTNSDLETSYSHADTQTINGYAEVFHTADSLLDGIMMTSIRYRMADDTPAVLSGLMVSRARGENNDLIVMTDDLWGESLRRYMLPASRARLAHYPDSTFAALVARAVTAGNDMLMITYPQKVPLMIEVITKMAASDPFVEKHVDNAVRRILKAKVKLGILGNGK